MNIATVNIPVATLGWLMIYPMMVQIDFSSIKGVGKTPKGLALTMKLPHSTLSPGVMIGASDFFELAVAVAISLFGLNSGATLVTVVGVLIEVPVMLNLVKISNKWRY